MYILMRLTGHFHLFKNGSKDSLLLNTLAAKLLLTNFNRISRTPISVRFILGMGFGLEMNIKIVQNFNAPGGAIRLHSNHSY